MWNDGGFVVYMRKVILIRTSNEINRLLNEYTVGSIFSGHSQAEPEIERVLFTSRFPRMIDSKDDIRKERLFYGCAKQT